MYIICTRQLLKSKLSSLPPSAWLPWAAAPPLLNLDGRTILPGFIDAHIHFLSYGLSLKEIDLMGIPSLEAAQGGKPDKGLQ